MRELDCEIVTPAEKDGIKLEMALQLLAVFIRRFGGEVVITAREFDTVEGLPLLACQVTPEHLRLRLDEDCYCDYDGVEGL